MVHDPEVGAIVVGSPTPFHAEQIIEAAKLGKHIFCEKVREPCSVALLLLLVTTVMLMVLMVVLAVFLLWVVVVLVLLVMVVLVLLLFFWLMTKIVKKRPSRVDGEHWLCQIGVPCLLLQ